MFLDTYQKKQYFCRLLLLLIVQIFIVEKIIAQDLNPKPIEEKVIRILAIGNSFSEDAIEHYLYDLAKAENIAIEIGNLYIGGASLSLHWKNANENQGAYTYRKIDVDGNKSQLHNISIQDALKDANWDYISFQQVSSLSGLYNSYNPFLQQLLDFTTKNSNNPEVKFILHQTWAYAKDSSHEGFIHYNSDQETMYASLAETYRRIYEDHKFDLLVPAGTAIQNGRNTKIGDNFTRDGYHLDLNIGRYTAACTWFEALTNISVVGNHFHPENLKDFEIEIAQHSAHHAILYPDQVTILDKYKQEDIPLSSYE